MTRRILKAVVVGARVQNPACLAAGEELAATFATAGALSPPDDPEALCLILEHSNSLRQNVDAYARNILPRDDIFDVKREQLVFPSTKGCDVARPVAKPAATT